MVGRGVVDIWAPSCTPESDFSVCPLVEGWCCGQALLAHPRVRRVPCSENEIQLAPQIPTRMSSVRYLVTNSRSSSHDFCCNRNTTTRAIQTEEKSLNMNSFIVQRKDRNLRPRGKVVSITITLAAPNRGVLSLSLDYPRSSRHELRCSRVPFLFLIL